MRWTPGGRSEDVEDVRGEGGGSGFRLRGPHLGIGGFLVVLVLSLLFKRDLFSLFGIANVGGPAATTASRTVPRGPEDDRQVQFVSFVLDDVQKTWSQAFAQAKRAVPARQARALQRRDALRVRVRGGRIGSLLLPGGPEGLHRPRLLPGAQDAVRRPGRVRPGLRDRPRDRAPRPEPPRHRRQGAAAAGPQPVAGPRAVDRRWSCRPTASPASGPTPPKRGTSWRRATWSPASPRRRRWATTGCSDRPGGGSARRRGRTAPRSSGWLGSGGACRPVASTHARPSHPSPEQARGRPGGNGSGALALQHASREAAAPPRRRSTGRTRRDGTWSPLWAWRPARR